MREIVDRHFDLDQPGPPELKHERLRRLLMGELRSGRFKPGEALPTVVELAEQFRVAPNTVRRAMNHLDEEGLIHRLRGKGTFVSDKTAAQNDSRLGIFALVVSESQGGHYPALIESFARTATDAHTQILVNDTANDIHKQASVLMQLLAKRPAGVAIDPPSEPTPANHVLMLQQQDIPIVQCHRAIPGVQAPLVSIPHREIGRMWGKMLAERGHRRVAMFDWSNDQANEELRIPGLRESLGAAGGELPDEFMYFGRGFPPDIPAEEKAMGKALSEMLGRPDRPTAIVTGFDSTAESIYLLCQRIGIRIPEDISLVSFGGRQRSGAMLHRLTSVVIDGSELGQRAYKLLREMRDGKRPIFDDQESVMSLSISDGETLGPPEESTVEILGWQ